jgi:hypothetical protein
VRSERVQHGCCGSCGGRPGRPGYSRCSGDSVRCGAAGCSATPGTARPGVAPNTTRVTRGPVPTPGPCGRGAGTLSVRQEATGGGERQGGSRQGTAGAGPRAVCRCREGVVSSATPRGAVWSPAGSRVLVSPASALQSIDGLWIFFLDIGRRRRHVCESWGRRVSMLVSGIFWLCTAVVDRVGTTRSKVDDGWSVLLRPQIAQDASTRTEGFIHRCPQVRPQVCVIVLRLLRALVEPEGSADVRTRRNPRAGDGSGGSWTACDRVGISPGSPA